MRDCLSMVCIRAVIIMANIAIHIDNLTVFYRQLLALEKVSASIPQGELVAIVGPNGAGKSTLVKSIMQQCKSSCGCVKVLGTDPKSIAYLPQSQQIDRKFPITVREFISAGAWNRIGFWGRLTGAENTLLMQALAQVNLDGVEDRQISSLSDGQFQRVLFARMLMQDADVLLLDEPFNAIDAQTTEDLVNVIKHCQSKGKTVIAVIHDLLLVQRFFPTTLLLATKLIAYGKTESVMTPTNLAKAGYQYFNHEAHQPATITNSQASASQASNSSIQMDAYPVAGAHISAVESSNTSEEPILRANYDS